VKVDYSDIQDYDNPTWIKMKRIIVHTKTSKGYDRLQVANFCRRFHLDHLNH